LTLTLLADANIPALEPALGSGVRVRREEGRQICPAQLRDVDILLVRSVTRVDERLLADSPVQFVGSATSGIDHVDMDYLRQRGIAFVHAPGANANSVVEYVLCAIAAVDDRLERLLDGGTVGIVGYGYVGRTLAVRLSALGVRHLVYDPWLEQRDIPAAASLDEILACDVVSLHPELTRAQPWPSYHLVGASELSRMRPDSLLINSSRGPVVDNEALRTRLDCTPEFRAVLDVWETEPAVDPALLARVALGTPHIAGYSRDGKLRATAMLVQALADHCQLTLAPATGPGSEVPAIRVGAYVSRAASVRSLLRSRYDILVDDRRLRFEVGNAAHIGEAFDRLRRTYGERRELAGSCVAGADGAWREAAAALGCVPASSGP